MMMMMMMMMMMTSVHCPPSPFQSQSWDGRHDFPSPPKSHPRFQPISNLNLHLEFSSEIQSKEGKSLTPMTASNKTFLNQLLTMRRNHCWLGWNHLTMPTDPLDIDHTFQKEPCLIHVQTTLHYSLVNWTLWSPIDHTNICLLKKTTKTPPHGNNNKRGWFVTKSIWNTGNVTLADRRTNSSLFFLQKALKEDNTKNDCSLDVL